MALPAQNFQNITPNRFAALAVMVQQKIGIAVSGNSGTATYKDYTLTWSYDPVTKMLMLQCLKKPLLIPVEIVQSKIRSWVDENHD
jgi:hypothetical protein